MNRTEPGNHRGFWGLIGLQFQGAFSDNVFRYTLMMIVLTRFGSEDAGPWNSILGAVFSLPFILFSGFAGALADRFNKRFLTLAAKVAEIFIMALGGVVLYWYARDSSSAAPFYCLVAVLFLMATQSTFFSPSKYGILPEILATDRLAWGNGIMGMSTFIAIIFGMIAANALFIFYQGGLERISIYLVVLAFLGLASGWFIDRVPAAKPDTRVPVNPLPEVWKNLKIIMADRILLMAVLGVSYIWAVGILVLSNAPILGRDFLGLAIPDIAGGSPMDKFLATLTSPGILIAPIAIGIGVGSVLTGFLSKGRIELGFVLIGGLGIALFSLPLGLTPTITDETGQVAMAHAGAMIPILVSLTMLGVSTGLFSVPLNAMIQHRAPDQARGGVIAAMNFVNFICMLLASVLNSILLKFFDFEVTHVFTLIAIFTLGTTVFFVALMPETLLSLVSTLISSLVYRIHVLGRKNIPSDGAALLVSNRVSIVDALLISSLTSRPVRFIVWKEIFQNPILGVFLKIMKAIPISSDQRPREVLASLGQAAEALHNGELVCVFAEGQITRTGLPLPYRRGFHHILAKSPAPIIPIYIDGVLGDILHYERKQYRWNLPRRLRTHLSIAIGEALPPEASMHRMRQSVMGLNADCAIWRKNFEIPLHHHFIGYARRHWRRFCVGDSQTTPLRYGRTLVGAILLARKLRPTWKNQTAVGIYLPPSVGAALVNIAATLSGRAAVNLNYTMGPDILNHCIQSAGLETVITSRLFLRKLKADPPAGAVFIDDLRKDIDLLDKLGAYLAGRLLSARRLERYCGAVSRPEADSLATIIFSSGSTGLPKGVMLTHFNIVSNIGGIEKAVAFWPDDRVIGILPFFHSFGYTVTLWGALCIGFGVVHHPNPLEAKIIGDLAEKYRATVMVATPTFLQNFTRRIEPAKFRTLEFILTGAEKLQARIAEQFEERFGMVVHEGYGATECSPVIAVNVDDDRSRGSHAVGSKRGSVGHPLPGVAVRITDVDNGDPISDERSGLIHVRGPNVMRGYLNMPEKTAEVIKDGWYDTGDIGFLDDDGFLHITDRLARFSKIGGEMVPHVKVEEELHRAIGATEQVFAVTALADAARGEQLAVLHTVDDEDLAGLGGKLAAAGLPNLWIPKPAMFFRVEAIPMLGTGKIDLAKLRLVAQDSANCRRLGPRDESSPRTEG